MPPSAPRSAKPLQEAQSLAAAGNYRAAMAQVNEAEAVGGLTAEESRDRLADAGLHRLEVESSTGGKASSPRTTRPANGAR